MRANRAFSSLFRSLRRERWWIGNRRDRAVAAGQPVMQNHVEQRFMHPNAAPVFDEAELAEAVHEKVTGDRVVPIISARLSWVILGIGFRIRPAYRLRHQKKDTSQSLLAGIEELG